VTIDRSPVAAAILFFAMGDKISIGSPQDIDARRFAR
jgi:hypothetical protein